MQIRIFSIVVSDLDRGCEELNGFLRSHRIATVDREFVADGSNSFWSICVTYTEGQSPTPHTPARKRIDYRDVLNESDFAIFAKLRTLRKSLADKEGVPAYALFTNEQLAELVKRRCRTKSALGEILSLIHI